MMPVDLNFQTVPQIFDWDLASVELFFCCSTTPVLAWSCALHHCPAERWMKFFFSTLKQMPSPWWEKLAPNMMLPSPYFTDGKEFVENNGTVSMLTFLILIFGLHFHAFSSDSESDYLNFECLLSQNGEYFFNDSQV